ncbi:wsv255 [White spot syndrome virus]|uniref:Wsv255 n=1 Tax=White spot syndrome virus TaxID=342409 RepID=K7WX42_9VIRU|nr:wsv255 [White spot syndrome virus]
MTVAVFESDTSLKVEAAKPSISSSLTGVIRSSKKSACSTSPNKFSVVNEGVIVRFTHSSYCIVVKGVISSPLSCMSSSNAFMAFSFFLVIASYNAAST